MRCAACGEEIDTNEVTVKWNGSNYHTECVDTTPRMTPRTQHPHRVNGAPVWHAHAGGLEAHDHVTP